MTTVTTTCDLCNRTIDTSLSGREGQVWSVMLAVAHGAGKKFTSYQTKLISADWCSSCTEKYGLIPDFSTPVVVEPNLEDIIRNIVAEELEKL